MSGIFTAAFFFAVVLQTTPLLLAALGGMFSQQANVLNIALDGMMLTGAFAAISVGAKTQSALLAVLAAMAAGLVVALLFGFVSLFLAADLVVVGIGIGTLTAGLSIFLLSTLYGNQGSYAPQPFPELAKIHLGALKHVPVLGAAFEGQSVLVLLALLLVPVSSWVLYQTRYGLRVRAVGEEEPAVVAAGLRPRRIQMSTVLISGLLCGMAGAQLAMATLGQFVANMTAGRGFIALAAILVGRARPVGTLLGCLIFGLVSALAIQLQLKQLPSDLMLMLPYVVTVVVLIGRPALQELRQRRRVAGLAAAA
jgi:general nucleoside transport system permease protein